MADQLERLVTLEANYKHMADKLDHMSGKVDDLHEMMTEAKGAKWAIMTVVGIVSFISGLGASFAAWLGYWKS